MGKRMATTSEQISPAKKPVEDGRTVPKRDHDRVRESSRSRVEPFDWRGEGVVGNNHTD
jgi:hypothetical protein